MLFGYQENQWNDFSFFSCINSTENMNWALLCTFAVNTFVLEKDEYISVFYVVVVSVSVNFCFL